jgi:HSP20 family protein
MPNEITRHPLWRESNREIVPLRTMMDRLLENAFMPMSAGWGDARGGMFGGFSLDVEEDDTAYYVKSHLPGIKPEEVNVRFQDGVLTISGETKRESKEGHRPVHQEIQYGRFERQLALPGAVDAEKAEASYRDGILEITFPKSEASRPRSIQVKTGGREQAGAAR